MNNLKMFIEIIALFSLYNQKMLTDACHLFNYKMNNTLKKTTHVINGFSSTQLLQFFLRQYHDLSRP